MNTISLILGWMFIFFTVFLTITALWQLTYFNFALAFFLVASAGISGLMAKTHIREYNDFKRTLRK